MWQPDHLLKQQATPQSQPGTPSDDLRFSLHDYDECFSPQSKPNTQKSNFSEKITSPPDSCYETYSQLNITNGELDSESKSISPNDSQCYPAETEPESLLISNSQPYATKDDDDCISFSSLQSADGDEDPEYNYVSTSHSDEDDPNFQVSSQMSKEPKTRLRPDEDEISVEERFERLSTLLERSSIFTEVVGSQVRKQQGKRKRRKETDQKSRPLKDLVLKDISPRLMNVEKETKLHSGEELAPLAKKHRGEEVMPVSGKRSRARDQSASENSSKKRVKSMEVRYFNDEPIPPEQPKLLTGGVLRNYQVDGFDWMRILYENGINGILADEMGLGKTIQAIAIICYLIERGVDGPFLVLGPLSTLRNWRNEFARFAPTIYTTVYHGTKAERAEILEKIKTKRPRDPALLSKSNKRPVVITHYDLIRYDFSKLCKIKWSYTILDEGHKIKNHQTATNKLLNKMRCDNCLILTGTPFQNNLPELWSLLNFLMPDIFGNDKHTFHDWFDVRGNLKNEVLDREKQMPVVEMIQKIIRPFIMRRMKGDVDLNLPPKKEILVYCPLTRIQKNFYRAILDRTIMLIMREEYSVEEEPRTEEADGTSLRSNRRVDYTEMSDNDFMKIVNGQTVLPLTWTGEVVKTEKSDTMPVQINISTVRIDIHLRKVVNHPYLIAHPYDQLERGKALIVSDETVEISGKMRILDRMLGYMIPKGHKILIYSQWVRILDLVQDLMEMRDIKFVRLDGSRDLADRDNSIEQFQNDVETKCFLITTRAGGLGINLTAADTVIIYDSDWNPHVDQQAQDRCHRIGQTLPVIVYRLVAARTIDQKLVERAYNKKKLDKILINNKDFCMNSWTQNKIAPVRVEDLQELLTELEYDQKIGEGDDFTEEQIEALLNRENLIEGVTNKMYSVICDQAQANEE